MDYITLYNGKKIEKFFFESRLLELKKEMWSKKSIDELYTDHVDCDLTLSTISKNNCNFYYESDNNSCITVEAFEHYIK